MRMELIPHCPPRDTDEQWCPVANLVLTLTTRPRLYPRRQNDTILALRICSASSQRDAVVVLFIFLKSIFSGNGNTIQHRVSALSLRTGSSYVIYDRSFYIALLFYQFYCSTFAI